MTRLLLLAALLAAAPAALAQSTAAQADDRVDTTAPSDPDASADVAPEPASDAVGSSAAADEVGCADDGAGLTPFTGVASGGVAGAPDETACLDRRTGVVADVAAPTPAEAAVKAQIAQDGLHVVHFWAPWCPNSLAELEAGWYEVIENHPDVAFTFVTIWNDGEAGQATLDRYAIPERVTVLTQPDFGESADKSQRRRTFLGLPVTWIPTTWVFHENGELAVAYNYGELDMAQLDEALALVRADWSH